MKKDILFLSLMMIVYLSVLLFIKPQIFSYKFSNKIVNDFLHSQNIFGDVKNRIFVSDETIYMASGYLYAKGANPIQYNFEHPPFLKYIFGISIIIFNNPYVAQIAFGILFLWLTYYLGKRILNNSLIAQFITCFLIFDPLFLNLSSEILLDLGHAFFSLSYLTISIYFPSQYIISGVLLGLSASSKFWAASIFYIGIVMLNLLLNRKKAHIKFFIFSILIALLIYMLTYLKAFLDSHMQFNFLFFQLKMLKYWLQHNVSSYFGASIVLFITGYVKSWWGNSQIIRSNIWSIFWSISLILAILNFFQIKNIQKKLLLTFIPIGYLIYLGVQAPFARYFIPVIPFFYLNIGNVLVNIINKTKNK